MADGASPSRSREVLDAPARERLWTVTEFDRLGELGFFSELGRHELWSGRVVMAPPPGGPHMDRENRIGRQLILAIHAAGLDESFRVLSGGGLALGERTLLGPDVMVIRLPWDSVARPSPEQVVLVVEVAHSSLPDDLGLKREKYAGAGIPEYWVIDVAEGLLHRFTGPRGGDYPPANVLAPGAEIAPDFARQLRLHVTDIV